MTDQEKMKLIADYLQIGVITGFGVFPSGCIESGHEFAYLEQGDVPDGDDTTTVWAPLAFGNDSLKLSCDLGISITHYPIRERPTHSVICTSPKFGDEDGRFEAVARYDQCGRFDPSAAVRRAVFECAVLIAMGRD